MNTQPRTIQQLRNDLNARFPERRDVIDGALCAVVAGEQRNCAT